MRSRPLTTAQIAAIRAFAETGHPRLFVDSADRESILARASSPGEGRVIAEEFRAVCERYFDADSESCVRLDELTGHQLLARPRLALL